jgi:cysteinyl-tRNA synthetase
VYNFAHIGNFRTYIFEDLLRRYLQYKGYKVIQVMNITDVEDKTIREAKKAGISLTEYTQKYEKFFFEDLDTLGIERAEYYPRATEHIDEMIALIKQLQGKGFTYEKEGSIYFDISKCIDYGKLSNIEIDKTKTGQRYDTDEYTKDDVRDFVLWKAKKGDEPSWKTELGDGRPGWHIECSAMSMRYLGESFDIHTGGVDNIFPHHENEIAQSEGATSKKFVNFWLHSAHLTLKTDKMSKSLGNILNVRQILEKGFSKEALRYFLVSAHYKSPLAYSEEAIEASEKAVENLKYFYDFISDFTVNNNSNPIIERSIKEAKDEFVKNFDDDLNSAGALGAIFTFIRTINKEIITSSMSQENKNAILSFFHSINSVLGVIKIGAKELLDVEIEALIQKRNEAREHKDFALSDKIRLELQSRGIILEDRQNGTRWVRKK